ncbi:MAG: hypothetical protein Q7R70_00880 [Candidatus Diapherotrites archaeon]|nr:hypothetical protein [Candidatus Diapherotrites archaeon]
MAKVKNEFPESELVRRTFMIREMDLPPQVQLTRRSMLRWFALASGMISEKESRSTVLEVLDALFYFQFQKKQDPTAQEVIKYIKEKHGKIVSEKLLRYHLNRLILLNLLQRKSSRYFFNPSPYAERKDLKASFNYWIREHLEKSLKDCEFVLGKLQDNYSK